MSRNSQSQQVFALGECMIELRERRGESLSFGFAGDTLNTATYLRRLLPADTHSINYVSAIGDDPLSEKMLAQWHLNDIGTGLVQHIRGELPGLYWIHTDNGGEREFYYWRSASAARKLLHDGHAARIAAALSEGDLLYLSGISVAILDDDRRLELLQLLDTLRQAGVRVAFDTNYRARLWRDPEEARHWHRRTLAAVDIFITSFPDEAAIFGDADIEVTAGRMQSLDLDEWVIRGDPGVTITRDDGQVRAEPIDGKLVVDTTGAGDSFDAGYLAVRLTGGDTRQAVSAGHALAAIVVQYGGAIIPTDATPTLSELVSGRPE